ncbi:ABC-type branched-chain amino acid transport system, substrate-binding protein [Salinihabitans flavidus]|uniref:ABC-type branched-chain amino acid transport system, substrate-binding protein n=1 Tax=Salinihabitans flavidus TaxID=569882 RepID=A0A1H8PJN8_9RHOB|nr:ABC transporter substrate-binding protein [Salinihabitans flavidus]SEO42150.1 ABC-type branched-chain amino acid transport system, substrate-binding protein [Salinihabitans flavidus]
MKRIAIVAIAALATGPAFAADPGVTDTEIRIGDVNIMTGAASFIGRAVSVGSKIAAAEINDAGGVNGRMIKIITEDDGYVPSRSFQALSKLIEVDEIFALNGTSGTANVLAMMPLIEENNLPTIVSTAPNELVYDPVRPSVFTLGASYSDAFYAQLKYINDNVDIENPVYGLIRQDDDFGVAVEHGYNRAVEEFGVEDAARIRFKKGTSNFSAEVAQLDRAGVNVLANGGIISGAANILSEARKLGMDIQSAQVWSEDMPPSVNLAAQAGYDYYVADYVALTGEANDAFLETAREYVSEDEIEAINRYTYVTYAALHAMAEAMSRCGEELTRDCTIENLRQLEDFPVGGIMAPISFNNENQLSGTAVSVYQLDADTQTFTRLTEFVDY